MPTSSINNSNPKIIKNLFKDIDGVEIIIQKEYCDWEYK
jgi:hypothetical protein